MGHNCNVSVKGFIFTWLSYETRYLYCFIEYFEIEKGNLVLTQTTLVEDEWWWYESFFSEILCESYHCFFRRYYMILFAKDTCFLLEYNNIVGVVSQYCYKFLGVLTCGVLTLEFSIINGDWVLFWNFSCM